MNSYDYFRQQKEALEREQFRIEIMEEVRTQIQTSMDLIKQDILDKINREIDITINAIMEGKKIGSFDIGEYVADEVYKSIKSII